MSFQFADRLHQLFLRGGILGERLDSKRGIKLVPDGGHLALEVAGVGGDGDDGVLFGNDDAELTAGAVAAKGVMRAAPELEAIALLPVNADLDVGVLVVG